MPTREKWTFLCHFIDVIVMVCSMHACTDKMCYITQGYIRFLLILCALMFSSVSNPYTHTFVDSYVIPNFLSIVTLLELLENLTKPHNTYCKRSKVYSDDDQKRSLHICRHSKIQLWFRKQSTRANVLPIKLNGNKTFVHLSFMAF